VWIWVQRLYRSKSREGDPLLRRTDMHRARNKTWTILLTQPHTFDFVKRNCISIHHIDRSNKFAHPAVAAIIIAICVQMVDGATRANFTLQHRLAPNQAIIFSIGRWQSDLVIITRIFLTAYEVKMFTLRKYRTSLLPDYSIDYQKTRCARTRNK
jgi:hypothetical protein